MSLTLNAPGRRSVIRRIDDSKYLYLFLAPALIYFVTFHYVPMFGIQIAFKDFSAAKGISRPPAATQRRRSTSRESS